MMDDVGYAICDVQGNIFEYVANHYIYETFTAFVPAFLRSDFCRRNWDTPYSRYQIHDAEENLDFILPELSNIQWKKAEKSDQIFDPSAAHWIGFMYRALYLQMGIASAILFQKIPLSQMCAVYLGLHTIAEEDAIQELKKQIQAAPRQ